jgi:hypothetical protein
VRERGGQTRPQQYQRADQNFFFAFLREGRRVIREILARELPSLVCLAAVVVAQWRLVLLLLDL